MAYVTAEEKCSLDEKDEEVSEEQKKEEQISYACHDGDSNSLTHTLLPYPLCLLENENDVAEIHDPLNSLDESSDDM